MDPCPFVRLTVSSLALKTPSASKPARSAIHPTSSPCFCRIKLKHFPSQNAAVPETSDAASAATFHLSKADLERISSKAIFSPKVYLKVEIYTGGAGSTCGLSSGRMIGKVSVPLDLVGSESKGVVFHNGWIELGKEARFHLCVRAEPDPRFVFEFDGDVECSPQVFQIQGNIRQPVFTCKFSFRSNLDPNHRTRSLPSEPNCSLKWLRSFGSERERPRKERKGWSVTVHDLSGSPVAAASMVTPFVASPGSDRVSRSNPGSWLILRPSDGTWKPWGRLEAWRERGSSDGLGFRFELIPENSGAGIVLVESVIGTSKGGKLLIDLGSAPLPANGRSTPSSATSPACSPRGSGDYGYGLWPYCMYKGFVMSATVEGEGSKCSKPKVEVSVNHVQCTEDAAAFIALSAAIDLSMDACRLFSQKLRKELCPPLDLLT